MHGMSLHRADTLAFSLHFSLEYVVVNEYKNPHASPPHDTSSFHFLCDPSDRLLLRTRLKANGLKLRSRAGTAYAVPPTMQCLLTSLHSQSILTLATWPHLTYNTHAVHPPTH